MPVALYLIDGRIRRPVDDITPFVRQAPNCIPTRRVVRAKNWLQPQHSAHDQARRKHGGQGSQKTEVVHEISLPNSRSDRTASTAHKPILTFPFSISFCCIDSRFVLCLRKLHIIVKNSPTSPQVNFERPRTLSRKTIGISFTTNPSSSQ